MRAIVQMVCDSRVIAISRMFNSVDDRRKHKARRGFPGRVRRLA
jgi:hypothetical protein